MKELEPVTMGQVLKDLDNRYENLVKGLRYIQIKACDFHLWVAP
jgi:Cell morphogenesis N-terminal